MELKTENQFTPLLWTRVTSKESHRLDAWNANSTRSKNCSPSNTHTIEQKNVCSILRKQLELRETSPHVQRLFWNYLAQLPDVLMVSAKQRLFYSPQFFHPNNIAWFGGDGSAGFCRIYVEILGQLNHYRLLPVGFRLEWSSKYWSMTSSVTFPLVVEKYRLD